MELEEGRGKKGQARQANRQHDDEWGSAPKKSFRDFRAARKNKQARYDEEVEQIDELSKKTLGRYVTKATDDSFDNGAFAHSAFKRGDHDMADHFHKKGENRRIGVKNAVKRLTKEGLEAIEIGINEYFLALGEEVDQETFDAILEEVAENLVEDLSENSYDLDTKIEKKSKSEVIDSIVEKYSTPVEVEELSEEEFIIDSLSEYVSEKTIIDVLELYDSLDEANKEELLDAVTHREGINEVLNFVLENQISEAHEDGHYVTDHKGKIKSVHPTQQEAFKHSDKLVDNTGKNHPVFHVKNGKVHAQHEMDGGAFSDHNAKQYIGKKFEPNNFHIEESVEQ